MKFSRFTLTMAALLLTTPAYTMTVAMKEERPGLLNKAKITAASATATAQARVPKGKIVSAEIEEEGGRLLFSFDVRTKGETGIDEVNVDATTGKIANVQHETPKDEAAETVADKKTK